LKVVLGTPGMKVNEMLVVDVPDPPTDMAEETFAMRLARHLKMHEMSLPTIAAALNLSRNRMGKLMIPQCGTPQYRAAEEIRHLAIKYGSAGAEDTVDQLVKTIKAMMDTVGYRV
jgi:hypothetical protein